LYGYNDEIEYAIIYNHSNPNYYILYNANGAWIGFYLDDKLCINSIYWSIL